MITCPSCGKQNQDHYKFCLGCGAELPRDAPDGMFDETAPAGVPAASQDITDEPTALGTGDRAEKPLGNGQAQRKPVTTPPAAKSPAKEEAAGEELKCPQCGEGNPSYNRFCASCGYRLDETEPSAEPSPPEAPAGVAVITALNPDGAEAGSFPLPEGATTVGRETGGVFAGDSFLSPKHATFTPKPAENKVIVRDEHSLNGVFRKLVADKRHALNPGQVFRIGQELIRFEVLDAKGPDKDGVELMGSPADGYVGRITLVVGRKTPGPAFPVPAAGLNLGRERGEVLFPDDGYVSGLHCRLSCEDDQVYLTDLGSSNGTFLRIMGEDELANGDILLMGQQLFRITL